MRRDPTRMPFRRLWRRALREVEGAHRARRLLPLVEAEYVKVLADRPPFVGPSRALTFHYERSLATMVAVHRVVRAQEGGDGLATMQRLQDARLRPLVSALGALSRVPLPWAVVRWAVERMMGSMFPAPGWVLEWQERSSRRVAFDVHECLYARVFAWYAVPELTQVSCHGDDLLFARLPGGARFVREGTIGRGQAVCDIAVERARPRDGGHPLPAGGGRA